MWGARACSHKGWRQKVQGPWEAANESVVMGREQRKTSICLTLEKWVVEAANKAEHCEPYWSDDGVPATLSGETLPTQVGTLCLKYVVFAGEDQGSRDQ